jgi:hypothetical protein
MELIGDPMNLFDNLGTGVAAFFIKTRSEMIGSFLSTSPSGCLIFTLYARTLYN